MSKSPLVFEKHSAGPWRLKTADLQAVRAALGADVLVAFCRAYVHVDRLDSLIDMYAPVLTKHGIGSQAVRAQRNWVTFWAMASGILKELSLVLADLRAALIKNGIWDQAEWEAGLKKWEDWGGRSDVSAIRNKLAFHVEKDVIVSGLGAVLSRAAPEVILYAGDDADLKDSWFQLAHDAIFVGAMHELGVGTAEQLYEIIGGMFGVVDHLDQCWGMSLKRADIEPEVVHSGS